MDNSILNNRLRADFAAILRTHPEAETVSLSKLNLTPTAPVNPDLYQRQEVAFANQAVREDQGHRHLAPVSARALILKLNQMGLVPLDTGVGVAPEVGEEAEARQMFLEVQAPKGSIIERTRIDRQADGSLVPNTERFIVTDSAEVGESPSIQTVYFITPFHEAITLGVP